jgi:RimJ/RimL family protein N-acetyltransferase
MSLTREPDAGTASEGKRYFLQSERLGFRAWSHADLELAMDLWGDPEVTRLIGGPLSREQVQTRLTLEIGMLQSHGLQYWPIFLRSTGEHLGCCGLRPYKADEKVYEIGVHLKKPHWGKGYALEATRAVMKYAFETLEASGLFAGHNPANEPSRQVLRRLGFRYTHDEYYPPTGLNHPSYILTAEEFAQR